MRIFHFQVLVSYINFFFNIIYTVSTHHHKNIKALLGNTFSSAYRKIC